jgi:hypothetical protein
MPKVGLYKCDGHSSGLILTILLQPSGGFTPRNTLFETRHTSETVPHHIGSGRLRRKSTLDIAKTRGDNVGKPLARPVPEFPDRGDLHSKKQKIAHPESTSPKMEATIELSSDEGHGTVTRGTPGYQRPSQTEPRSSQRSVVRSSHHALSQEFNDVEAKMMVRKRPRIGLQPNGDDRNAHKIISDGHSPSRGTSRDQPVNVEDDPSLPPRTNVDSALGMAALREPGRKNRLRSSGDQHPQVVSKTSPYFHVSKLDPPVDLTSEDDEVEQLPGRPASIAQPSSSGKLKSIKVHEDSQNSYLPLNQRLIQEHKKLTSKDRIDDSADELTGPAQNNFLPPSRRKQPALKGGVEIPDSESDGQKARSIDIPSQFNRSRRPPGKRNPPISSSQSTKRSARDGWSLSEYKSVEGEHAGLMARLDGTAKVITFYGMGSLLDPKYNINLMWVTRTFWSHESNLVRLMGTSYRAWDLKFGSCQEAASFVDYVSSFLTDTIEKKP